MDEAQAIRKGENLDWKKLEDYLRASLPELSGTMSVGQFYGGHANLTYLLKFGAQELVLRRPPFGKIAPGAHDMKREYRVLSKLYKHFPQAPRAYHLCMEEEIIGAKFVVMERRKGIIVRYKVPEIFKAFENVEKKLTDALIEVLAKLHKVNVETADLSQLGRPEGFVERQLAGWSKRWELSKTEDNMDMDKVFELLNAKIPKAQAVSIIHNDIKFDNCQFQPDSPNKITSLFDWDMTTLGDPLIDLGSSLSYWPDERMAKFKNLPVALKGNFPPKSYLIKKYQECTGFSLDNIAWYEAFSYWKGAIIAQQLYKRFVDGATSDKRMGRFGASAKSMALVAKQIIEQ